MKKIIGLIIVAIFAILGIYYAFVYFATYSEGVRSGELIKFSSKGYIAKTWEGEISQGISGAQIFSFSVLDKDKEVIEKLQEYQGQYVKLHYIERYSTFFWLGDSKYFVTEVKKEKSPHLRN
ncbi:6-phosphogluconate dehydrogenase [Cellulophaga baltica]|uniref:6-phosphogluconate dehydrogenase n=1 Tax=Cellulophaga TaxID=104264 RepID=UPI001C06526A|nr:MULTISPECIES: 6-phosphogluconate dehydrogenase [Cellulophaga]MBU2997408.1 6-phosphogluconate dehydrogenase [Cellulophaga baltica]MDO6768805.1 6-phosphogluconate dehydrogenase [Cellulophaga sp. 1_MG-2023]